MSLGDFLVKLTTTMYGVIGTERRFKKEYPKDPVLYKFACVMETTSKDYYYRGGWEGFKSRKKGVVIISKYRVYFRSKLINPHMVLLTILLGLLAITTLICFPIVLIWLLIYLYNVKCFFPKTLIVENKSEDILKLFTHTGFIQYPVIQIKNGDQYTYLCLAGTKPEDFEKVLGLPEPKTRSWAF